MVSAAGRGGQGTDRIAVRDVVRDVVTELAPEELPLVAGLSHLGDDAAVRRLTSSAARHEPLGFGLGEPVALVTAIIWIAVQETVQQLVAPAVQSLSERLRIFVRRLLRRAEPPVALPQFGRDELDQVRRRVLELADENGLDPARAVVVADGVVARLALGTSEPWVRPSSALEPPDPEPSGANGGGDD